MLTDEQIETLAETFINGNLSDVRNTLARLTPLVAANVAVRLQMEIVYADRDRPREWAQLSVLGSGFRAQLERWAESEDQQ